MNSEAELAGYFAKYEPGIATLGKQVRAKLRERLPGLFEIVYAYHNQGALVISYSPTENGYEALVSLRVDPSGVKLFFAQGPLLQVSDPSKLLKGSAKTVRYVALGAIADFERPEIEALMAAELKLANVSLDPSSEGRIILKETK